LPIFFELARALAMSAAARGIRFAKWEAEKAGWTLANRGDTRYAAEKRLFNKQVTELRRNLVVENLNARRAAYVAAREKAQSRQADPVAVARREASWQMRRTETRARVEQHAAEAKAEYAKNRLRAVSKLAKHDAARTELKQKWLKNYLETNDVPGGQTEKILLAALESSGYPGERGLVSWLNRENLISKVNDMTWRTTRNPIEQWNGIAREIIDDENTERLGERMGGAFSSSVRLDNGARARTPAYGVAPKEDPAGEGDLESFVNQDRLSKVAEAIAAVQMLEGKGGPDEVKKDEP